MQIVTTDRYFEYRNRPSTYRIGIEGMLYVVLRHIFDFHYSKKMNGNSSFPVKSPSETNNNYSLKDNTNISKNSTNNNFNAYKYLASEIVDEEYIEDDYTLSNISTDKLRNHISNKVQQIEDKLAKFKIEKLKNQENKKNIEKRKKNDNKHNSSKHVVNVQKMNKNSNSEIVNKNIECNDGDLLELKIITKKF